MYVVCHPHPRYITNTSTARFLISTVLACIKLSFFFRKSPTVTDAFFQKHYNHIHSDLTVACKKFHAVKIARYVQLYQSPGLKGKLKELGMDVLEYDACSQIWVRKWEDWEAFAGSDEYRAALMPDAEKFMNLEKGIQVMAG